MSDHDPNHSDEAELASFFVLPDAERLEALAEFAAGAGHEINNPLATIIGRAQLLLRDEQDPRRRQMLLAIGAQAYRIRDMIGDTMLFARPPAPEFQNLNLAGIVERVLSKYAAEFADSQIRVVTNVSEDLVVRADPSQMETVLSELLRNSRQAMRDRGGEIKINAEVSGKQDFAVLELTDSGRGFTETERAHAFDPFFSGRQAGRGLGFGLCKCWRIVEQHSGRIEIRSSPEGPTTVRVLWPVARG
jgi:signal transduction histidine kinase